MNNDRRRLWTSLLFVGIFAPFVVVFVISLITPAPARLPATAPGAGGNDGANPLGHLLTSPHMAAGNRANAAVLAAGDGRDLWVSYPFTIEGKDGPVGASEMLWRSANSGAWSMAVRNGDFVWRSFPRAMAVLPSAGRTESSAYVFADSGMIDVFTLGNKEGAEHPPEGNLIKAATGDASGLFVLALGSPPNTATRPGDRVTPDVDYFTPITDTPGGGVEAATGPAAATTQAATASQATSPPGVAASAPAATASAPAAPAFFNAYWFRDSHWVFLPALGIATSDPTNVPTPSSLVSLVVSEGRLLAVWVDPTRPGELVVRALEVSKGDRGMAWSAPMVTRLREEVPAKSRLMTVRMEKAAYVLWSVPTGATVELHGGPLETRGGETGMPRRTMNVSLGTSGAGIRPELDVAVGAAENSFVAVMCAKDGTLHAMTFNEKGVVLSPEATVEPKAEHHEVWAGQNFMMALLIVAMTLSLWQWRQKPLILALPSGKVAAPLVPRGVAFLIDAVGPYVVTLIIFAKWDNSFELISTWAGMWARPDELFRSPEFLVFMGIYFVHVSAGEFLFRRSLGKGLAGLEVRMIDGRPPTLAAVLVRNLIRIPEMVIGFLILYALISEHRQRLGDLLARTVVVAPQAPDAGVGDDKKQE